MDKKITVLAILVVLVVVVLLMSVMQIFQLNDIKNKMSATGAVTSSVASGAGTIDMSDWTETEKMNYEHHGILPARLQGQSQALGTGMVGGC